MGIQGGVYRGKRILGHGGAIAGYFSHFAFMPDKKWGYIAFQNAQGPVVDIAGWRLIDDFLETPTHERAKINEE